MIVFEDKPFLEEDHPLALGLFQGIPPFLLSQILGLPMDQWQAIEKSDLKDEEKQRSNVLSAWGKTGHSVTWSVLVEILIELGLRERAQNACIEKGEFFLTVIHTSGYNTYVTVFFWFVRISALALYSAIDHE